MKLTFKLRLTISWYDRATSGYDFGLLSYASGGSDTSGSTSGNRGICKILYFYSFIWTCTKSSL